MLNKFMDNIFDFLGTSKFSKHKKLWDKTAGCELTREVYNSNKKEISAFKDKLEAAYLVPHKPAFIISDGFSTSFFGGGVPEPLKVASEMRQKGEDLSLKILR